MSGEPSVVVLGAGGLVGGAIVDRLATAGIAHVGLGHRDDRDSVPWATVSHVVNAAAVIPGPEATAEDHWDGNVAWIEAILPHLAGHHVVHFGTTSVFYRTDAYQVAKLTGEALLRANVDRFAGLTVLALPTLDDSTLVASIAAQAEAGERPTVTRLRYRFCAPDEVARHVVDDVIAGGDGDLVVETRLLTDRVRSSTAAPIDEGPEQDRTGRRDGWWVTAGEARSSFLSAWD